MAYADFMNWIQELSIGSWALISVGFGFILLLIIMLIVEKNYKPDITKITTDDSVFQALKGIFQYSKKNSLGVDGNSGFYNETRSFKKDGVKISVSLNYDPEEKTDQDGFNAEEKKQYYSKLALDSKPDSPDYKRAKEYLSPYGKK